MEARGGCTVCSCDKQALISVLGAIILMYTRMNTYSQEHGKLSQSLVIYFQICRNSHLNTILAKYGSYILLKLARFTCRVLTDNEINCILSNMGECL